MRYFRTARRHSVAAISRCLTGPSPSIIRATMSVEEAILDKVRRLPPAMQQEVLRFADGRQRNTATRIVPSRDRTREAKWIDQKSVPSEIAHTDSWRDRQPGRKRGTKSTQHHARTAQLGSQTL